MSARNIHSLSLYLSSTETSYEERRVQQQYRQIFNTTAQQQTPPAIKECPGSVQHFYTALSTPEMIMDTSPEGRHLCHTSTIFQRGLITPTTPCYTPEATSSDPRSTKVACRFPSSISTNLQTPVSIMSPDTPESPDEDFGFSLEEFEKRYVPMSHLPTPPMSSCALGDFKIASDLAKAPEVAPEFLGAFLSP